MNAEALFRRRLCWAAAACGAVWLTALGFHWYRAVPGRAAAEEYARKISIRQGEISLPRGALLHSSGGILAQSELRQDLIRLHPAAPVPAELRKLFGDRMRESALAVIGLTSAEVVALEPILRNASGDWEIRTREMRRAAEEWQEPVGKTEMRNGTLWGVSGLELQYDAELRGTPGVYEVRLDRQGNWIPGTWRWLRNPVPGKNVTVPPEVLQ